MAPGSSVNRSVSSQRTAARRIPPPEPQQRRTVQQRRSDRQGRVVPPPQRTPQQEQRLRVWQRTAAKRAARQVETEAAVVEREERLRAFERARPQTSPPGTERQQRRESYAEYVKRKHAAAQSATEAAEALTTALDQLFSTALAYPVDAGFRALKRPAVEEAFDAHGLDRPIPAPSIEDFLPASGHLPSWLPGQQASRERARGAAEAEYEQALAEHQTAEYDRVRRLSVAKREHQRRQAAHTARARAQHAEVDALARRYHEGDPIAVEEYSRFVLARRSWPPQFAPLWRVRYRPELCQLDVEGELPPPELLPRFRSYRYLPARDTFHRQPVPPRELNDRYGRLIAQTTLCALVDLFSTSSPRVVDVIQLNGRVTAEAAGTGLPVRPCLVSIAVGRNEYDALDPSGADPLALLARVDGRLSERPLLLAAVQPWADFTVAG
jgi:restriction system protein